MEKLTQIAELKAALQVPLKRVRELQRQIRLLSMSPEQRKAEERKEAERKATAEASRKAALYVATQTVLKLQGKKYDVDALATGKRGRPVKVIADGMDKRTLTQILVGKYGKTAS
jgi:hypothetical protein